jgi:hypothetical protein
MNHFIVIDELAIKECIDNSIYQSQDFDAGEALGKALIGDRSVDAISPRLKPSWTKDGLFLLHSRSEAAYLVIDPSVFDVEAPGSKAAAKIDDALQVFQRVCRFCLKTWRRLNLSPSESWLNKNDIGVVFPFPWSAHSGYRVTICRSIVDRRITLRHGTNLLFAFAGGFRETMAPTPEQERTYRRVMEDLTEVKINTHAQIRRVESIPSDSGYHPLILAEPNFDRIKYQRFDDWMARLTKEQRSFVTSPVDGPQRVEGPAGTGKTLCLLLRSFHLCKIAEEAQAECRVLFISHGEETKAATAVAFSALGEPHYHSRSRQEGLQSIELCTLQEWCGRVLGSRDLVAAQYLDQDALSAKDLRKLIIKDVIALLRRDSPQAFGYLSPGCRAFFESEAADYQAELLQHEIGVMIKGRASESLEGYLKLPTLAYCLPSETESDKRFVFHIYKQYQSELNQSGVFDTDDIVLSTMGRLNTPIWRRKRLADGYDAVVIDETHLFNFNELSIFHKLVKDPERPRIVFSIDRSQAPGERGITTGLVREVLTQSGVSESETRTKIVFRCSPAIVRLAEAVTSSAATLFTTFENPLVGVASVISSEDEVSAENAVYWRCQNDDDMCRLTSRRVKEIGNRLKCPPSEILVVAMHEALLPRIIEAFDSAGRKYVQITQRGDLEGVRRGEREGAVILALPDYVGGLEFTGVLIVGVDEGRVPPTDGAVSVESRHFVEFKACNRLYVAISRARLAVEMFMSIQRGPSHLLEQAISRKVINVRDES